MTSKLAQGTIVATCAPFKRMRIFVCTMLLGLVAAPFAARAAAPEFVIARDGKAEAVIVVHGGVTNGVRYAANELAKFLGRISGARFMVADKPVPGYRTILVGTPYKPQNPEELCVRVKDANTLEVTGDRSRGVLYAAYELLEHFGVVFCARDFDYVPRIAHLAIAGDYNKVDWPFMYLQRHTWSDTGWNDFAFNHKLRNHVSKSIATKAGYPDLAEDYPHSYNHAITTQWVRNRDFGKTHPEWYAWVRATDSRNFNWVCISNEEMWTQLLKEIGEHLAKHPGTRELSVAIGDCAHYCDCDSCMEKVREYLDPDGSEVPSVQCYLLANRVARTFGKQYPNLRFNFLPYGDRQPANPNLKLEPNVSGSSAELWRNHCLPADCNERSAYSLAQFCRNVAPGNGTYVWEYLANFRDWMIPFPNSYIIAQSFRYYKRLNVRGVGTQMQFCGCGDLSEMKLYLHGKLAWNPDLDVEELITTYCKANFGPGWKGVKEYIDLLEHARLRQRRTWYGCYVPDTSHFITDEDAVKMYRALQNAVRATAKDPVYGPRCRRAQIPGLGLAIWRYQDMLGPAARMKFKMPDSLEALWYDWNAALNDSANNRYHKWLAEGGADYGKRVTQMFGTDFQPTNRTPRNAVLSITAKDMTGGKRMTRQKDKDGTEYCQFKVALKGEPEKIWMNTGFAEIGYTATAEQDGDCYVFATLRVGATVDVDPASAYVGIYQTWFPNGFRVNGRMEIANQAIVGRKGLDGWQTICLGKRRINPESRIWVMPGTLNPVDYVDVKSFTFVDPRLIEGSVADARDEKAQAHSIVVGCDKFDRDRNVRIEQDRIDNFKYARLASFDTNAPVNSVSWTVKAAEAGDWNAFLKVRIGAAFALDHDAAMASVTIPSKCCTECGAIQTPARKHVSGSLGDEAWQLVSLGRVSLEEGMKVNLAPRAGTNDVPHYVDLHSVILLNPDYLAKTQPALPQTEGK